MDQAPGSGRQLNCASVSPCVSPFACSPTCSNCFCHASSSRTPIPGDYTTRALLAGDAADGGDMRLMFTQPVALLLVELEFIRKQLLHAVRRLGDTPTGMLGRLGED